MRTILELNLKERHDFQRWIIDDWVQDNGFVEVFYTSYNQRLAVDKEDTMGTLDGNSRRHDEIFLEKT